MNLTNTQFVFEGKLKRNLIIGMVIGAACLALTFFNDDQFHTRFWTNYLQNTVYFSGIAMMCFFFMCAQITAFGGWNAVIRRVWEAMSMFMLPAIGLLAVLAIGVWGHLTHLYHWNIPGIADPSNPAYDRIIAGKVSFLNPVWYTVGTVGFMSLWYFWASKVRGLSVAQDTQETASFDYYKKIRRWSASFLPIGGFLICVFLWQLLMAIDPHWYSTMFAWYSMISTLLGGLALTVMLIIYLKSKGYMAYVGRDHIHDVGKFLFGISVFWTYLWFDQFMLIWFANNGEETIYFKERMDHYPVLFWGNLLLNFITPFFILMRNDTKRKYGTMFFVAAVVFFGHWWDFFYMIKPGARIAAHEAIEQAEGKAHGATSHKDNVAPMPGAHDEKHELAAAKDSHGDEHKAAATHDAIHTEATPAATETAVAAVTEPAEKEHGGAHGDTEADPSKSFKIGFTIPGLEEIGILVGFLSLFLFFFFSNLSKASLVPMRDPFLEESLHHDTGTLIESEQEDNHGHH
jgi:hypothetical protein